MATNTANAAAFGGAVHYAPLGTTLPTDATTALDASFVGLGLVTEDGLQPTRDVSTDKPKDWNGDVIALLKTDDSKSFVFTLVEVFSDAVQKFLYGSDNVSVTAATSSEGTQIAVQDKAVDIDDCVLVFDLKYKDKKRRIVVPVANCVNTAEGQANVSNLSSYEITAEATKDDSGVRVYDYLQNDDVAAA